ncbi:hypothetical protein [Nocardioides panacihumi]|uniref:hypothetical protein n=1 Tax=Nocardioides panacihumi TaxID=400774 RepID=UPI0031D28E9C
MIIMGAAFAAPASAASALEVAPRLDGAGTIVQTPIDPLSGEPQALSCASDGSCLLVDRTGHYVAFVDGVWGAPRQFDEASSAVVSSHEGRSYVTGVSCASRDFCLAADQSGASFVYDGTTWFPNGGGPSWGNVRPLMSCWAVGQCLVIAASREWIDDGGTWSDPGDVPDDIWPILTSLTCVSADFCLASDSYGGTETFDGAHWSARTAVSPSNAGGTVSDCSSKAYCVLLSSAGYAVFDGSAWSPLSQLPAGVHDVAGLSCPSAGRCVAIAGDGKAIALQNGTWGAPTDPGMHWLRTVDCSSPTLCIAVDARGRASVFDGNAWSTPELVDPSKGELTAVDCPTASACTAVDSSGNLVRFDGAGWTAPTMTDPSAGFFDVSCPTADFCMVVGRYGDDTNVNGPGVATVVSGSAWTQSVVPHELIHVSCVSTTFCLASTFASGFWRWDGHGWSAVATPPAQDGNPAGWAVSCASPTFCMAGGAVFDGTNWHKTNTRDVAPWDYLQVSCISPTSCQGTAWAGAGAGLNDRVAIAHFDGARWSAPTPVAEDVGWVPGPAAVMDCPRTDMCAITTDGGWYIAHSAKAVADISDIRTDGEFIDDSVDASCPTVTRCFLLSRTAVTQWDGPVPPTPVTSRPTPAASRPIVTSQPVGMRTRRARVVRFHATASGRPAPTIQWQVSANGGRIWRNVAGARSTTLRVRAGRPTTTTFYRAVFRNSVGTAYSRAAKLVVRR